MSRQRSSSRTSPTESERAKVQIEFRDEARKKLRYTDVVIGFVYGNGTSEEITTKTSSSGKITIQRHNMRNDMWPVTVEIVSVTKGDVKYSPDKDSFVLTG